MVEQCSIVNMYHIFLIHLSSDGYPGCLHVLAITNSAVMNCDGRAKVQAAATGTLSAAERSYPTLEVRGRSREEIPHAIKPEARGGGREDQPQAVAARAQEGLEELSHVEGQEGRQ